MVDYLDCNLARFGLIKRPTGSAIKAAPCGLVDFGSHGSLQLLIRLVGPGEVGVPDKEAFAVVVGVDEPARDVVG